MEETHQLSPLMFPPSPSVLLSTDVDMEVDHFTNGVTESSSNGFLNGSSKHAPEPDDCEADMGGWSRPTQPCGAGGVVVLNVSVPLQRWSRLRTSGSCAAAARPPSRG